MAEQARGALRGAAPVHVGGVRRRRRDRPALPPPGRDRHAVGAHHRRADARRRHGHAARPRHARAGADPARGRDARCSRTASRSELARALARLRGAARQPARRPGGAAPVRVGTAGRLARATRRSTCCMRTCARLAGGSTWSRSRRSYPDAIDALAPEAVVVLVDGWTSVGGSQWIDSSGIGRYGTYLRDEVVAVRRRALSDERAARGCRGSRRAATARSSTRSSGRISSRRSPRTRRDALFEVTLAQRVPARPRASLRDRLGGSLDAFWASFAGLELSRRRAARRADAAALAFGDGTLPFDRRRDVRSTPCWSAGSRTTRCGCYRGRRRSGRGLAGRLARRGPARRVLPRPRRDCPTRRAARGGTARASGCTSSSSRAATAA